MWHIFPAVWLLSVLHVIDAEIEQLGYVCGDIAAKYLLLFVYVTTVSNH